jgi:hypothetical protein
MLFASKKCDKYPFSCILAIFISLIAYIIGFSYFLATDTHVYLYSQIMNFLNLTNLDNFLTVLITFYVGVLSFMIPISIQMIATIRKDFPTEQIENKFKSEFTFKWLPLLLISQIVYIGVLNIYVEENKGYPVELFAASSLFIWISYLIYLHIRKMIQYTDKDRVIRLLIKDTQKFISHENNLKHSIISLRSLSDILVNEIKETPNHDLLNKLIEDMTNFSISFIPSSGSYNQIKNENNIEYFKEIMNCIEKGTIKSIELKHYDITDKFKRSLHEIIKEIVKEDNNQIYLENLFNAHRSIFYYTIRTKAPYQHSFTYHWYSNHIFNWLNKSYIFNINYLDIFDKQQFYYIRYIIEKNKFKLFNGAISWFHHGLGFFHDINFYGIDKQHKMNDFRLVSNLDKQYKNILSKKDLDSFLENLNNFEKELLTLYEINEDIDTIKEKIQEARSKVYQKYYFYNLRNMIFGIASYCIYKQKYKYIYEIWHFKNPQDSTTHWIGHDIYPKGINEFLKFIVKNNKFDRKFRFSEDHHESDIYEREYELLLLGYIIYINNQNVNAKYIKFKDSQVLNSLKGYIEKLEEDLESIYNKKSLDRFKIIGFGNFTKSDLKDLKDNISTLLTNLKSECDQGIETNEVTQDISVDMVNEFRSNVIKNMQKYNSFINLLEYFDLYSKSEDSKKSTGFMKLLPRAMFFVEWISSYVGFDDNLSQGLVEAKNNKIIKTIIENSTITDNKNIENILSSFSNKENIFILNINHSTYFDSNKYFTDKWSKKVKQETFPDLESYSGELKYQDQQIPVFEFYIYGIEECILVLDKSQFIKFIQYETYKAEENLIDSYSIEIIDLKDKEDNEMKELLNIKEDSDTDLASYRKETLFKFNESFEININSNFCGYLINTKESEES